MDILKLLIFFLFLLSSSANSKNLCPISYCPNNTLPIKYPFKLQGHQTPNIINCSYTDLRCSNQGAVIFNLPKFGDFYVRGINYEYTYPLILLYDPQNCLPKRFMASNYSSLTPEEAAYFHDYAFYSCPPNNVAWENFPTVGCLSNSSSDVVAIRADLRKEKGYLDSCKEMFTLSMPVLRHAPPKYIEDEREFYLEWNASGCGSCSPEVLHKNGVMIIVFIVLPAAVFIISCIDFTRTYMEKLKMNRLKEVSITPLT